VRWWRSSQSKTSILLYSQQSNLYSLLAQYSFYRNVRLFYTPWGFPAKIANVIDKASGDIEDCPVVVTLKSEELRLAEGTLALIALRKPLHNAVSVELLLARLAALLRQLSAAVYDVEADSALLHPR
jgi:hypothetical protein